MPLRKACCNRRSKDRVAHWLSPAGVGNRLRVLSFLFALRYREEESALQPYLRSSRALNGAPGRATCSFPGIFSGAGFQRRGRHDLDAHLNRGLSRRGGGGIGGHVTGARHFQGCRVTSIASANGAALLFCQSERIPSPSQSTCRSRDASACGRATAALKEIKAPCENEEYKRNAYCNQRFGLIRH